MTLAFSQLPNELESIANQGLYRTRRVISSPQGIYLQVDGKTISMVSAVVQHI
jgi:8-amino-7-oxononanoate synthase